jgi:hypothetical protein
MRKRPVPKKAGNEEPPGTCTCKEYLAFVSGSLDVHDCVKRIGLFRHPIGCRSCRMALVEMWLERHSSRVAGSGSLAPLVAAEFHSCSNSSTESSARQR